MKLNFTLLIIFSFSLFSLNTHSQDISSTIDGGEYKFNENKTPCLTDEQREEVLLDIKANISLLKSQKRLAYDGTQQRAAHPLFSWPVKMKDGAPYNEVWAISNYVDHDPAYNQNVLDYNCGDKTYDTTNYNHLGVDIYTWPFGWKMMDNDEAIIVAAAPGQIIDIGRDKDDRSCSFNNMVWNAVYVQHDDGSVALYGHMKKNSPTSKNIGDTVERGEYLGIVGSSGNSTGPHLHFEVYSSINPDVLIDPYAGDCNDLNSDSWWLEQKPYLNPNINAVMTSSESPVFPTCPDTQDITNEKNVFAADETVWFTVYLRDQIPGSSLNLKVLRPDGTTFSDWDEVLAGIYSSSWYRWYGTFPNIPGEWTWRATYQGQVVDHKFTMGTLSVEDENFQTASIYPNPFNDVVNIQSDSPIQKVSVVDILGKTVMTKANISESIKEINLESLSKGLYFLTLEGNDNQKKIIKLIKE